jgi:hypothetical protein
MDLSFYSTIANKIKEVVSDSTDLKLLDVGFIKSLIDAGVEAQFLAADFSFTATTMARMNIRSSNTQIFVAALLIHC